MSHIVPFTTHMQYSDCKWNVYVLCIFTYTLSVTNVLLTSCQFPRINRP